MNKNLGNQKITVIKSAGCYHVVCLDKLIYVEANNHHCKFVFSDRKEPLRVYCTINTVANRLPEGFFRINRSFIVNVEQVIRYDDFAIVNHCGKDVYIPIANRDFLLYFEDFLE